MTTDPIGCADERSWTDSDSTTQDQRDRALETTEARLAQLPTADQMIAHAAAELARAYRALGDAADWLRSDWRGGALTPQQMTQRARMREAITNAKQSITGRESSDEYDNTDGW